MNRFLHDCACAIERDATVRIADDQLPWRRWGAQGRTNGEVEPRTRPLRTRSNAKRAI